MTRSSGISDTELSALVKTFSEDIGPDGEAAWRKLQAFPRNELVDRLRSQHDSLPGGEPRRYQIAFVLASLNFEYETNVKEIASVLSKEAKINEYADTAVSMLGRLLRRGHDELLKVLFSVAPSADASLAEALSDVLSEQLRANTRHFLVEVHAEPLATRSRVYELVAHGPLNEAELRDLRQRLKSLSTEPQFSDVVKEILSSNIFGRKS